MKYNLIGSMVILACFSGSVIAMPSSNASHVTAPELDAPASIEQKLFSKSIVFNKFSSYCAANTDDNVYTASFQQWLSKNQEQVKLGRTSLNKLAMEEGRTMEDVVVTLNHVIDQKWISISAAERIEHCTEILKEMKS